MTLKSINPLSMGKVAFVCYAMIGLIAGLMVALVSLLAMGGAAGDDLLSEVPGLSTIGIGMFGVGAVIALPLLYGFLGALGGLVLAAIYNIAAGITGGIEVRLE